MGKLGEEEDEGEPAIERRREYTVFGFDSFTNHTFHLSRPLGCRRAFDAAERNRTCGRIQCQRGKKRSSRGKRKRRVFLCRRTVGVKVGSKAIPGSFLKIEGGGRSLGQKTGERGTDRRIGRWLEPRFCSTSQEPERAREEGAKEMSGEERLPEERCRRVSLSGLLRGRRSEEMTQSNNSRGGGKYLLSPRRGDCN